MNKLKTKKDIKLTVEYGKEELAELNKVVHEMVFVEQAETVKQLGEENKENLEKELTVRKQAAIDDALDVRMTAKLEEAYIESLGYKHLYTIGEGNNMYVSKTNPFEIIKATNGTITKKAITGDIFNLVNNFHKNGGLYQGEIDTEAKTGTWAKTLKMLNQQNYKTVHVGKTVVIAAAIGTTKVSNYLQFVVSNKPIKQMKPITDTHFLFPEEIKAFLDNVNKVEKEIEEKTQKGDK